MHLGMHGGIEPGYEFGVDGEVLLHHGDGKVLEWLTSYMNKETKKVCEWIDCCDYDNIPYNAYI